MPSKIGATTAPARRAPSPISSAPVGPGLRLDAIPAVNPTGSRVRSAGDAATVRAHANRCAEEGPPRQSRSEEHTSELQSLTNLVCRLLLEKKKDQTPLH